MTGSEQVPVAHSYRYDEDANALYVYLRDPGKIERTVELSTGIFIDLDVESNVLGVEVLVPNHHPWGLAELARNHPSVTEANMDFLAFLSASTWRCTKIATRDCSDA